MSSKRVITKCGRQMVSAVFSETLLTDFKVLSGEEGRQLGDIYVCRIQNVVKNISAAFVEMEKGSRAYLSMQEGRGAVLAAGTRQRADGVLCQGDALLVQLAKEAQKSKPATVTTRLDIQGKYVVLTHGRCRGAVSAKITEAYERKRLGALLDSYITPEYGFIARTCSQGVSEQALREDVERLCGTYGEMIKAAAHSVPGQKLYGAPPEYIGLVRNRYGEMEDMIVTDIPEVYENIRAYCEEDEPDMVERLSLYTDAYPLTKLYSLDAQIEKLLRKKVWLNSGGFLVIEPTEALVSIDVNTGKAVKGKKGREETYASVNLEAAKEIARQLRLRNLSGIILVDFIDMEEEEHRGRLLSEFRKELQKDSVKTVLVDMTKLGLVEITRKKIQPPLHEIFKRESQIPPQNV